MGCRFRKVGTSTDTECAQVVKHRRRREKENRDKEIIAFPRKACTYHQN